MKLKLLYIPGRPAAILWLVLHAFTVAAGEGFEFTPRLLAAYSDIQKLRLEKAGAVLKEERAKQPSNGFIPYLESYSDFFYFLVSDNQKEYGEFGKKQDRRLGQLAKLSPASPYQRMMMAEVRLHSAFVKLKFGSRTSGCWDIVKANRLLEENVKLFPGFVPHLKARGLLHVMIGAVPGEYQWVARMMGLKGSIREGLAELRKVEKESEIFDTEAQVTALLLHAYVLHPDEKLISELKKMPYRQPDNLLFHFLSASILMKRGESEAALAILDKAPGGGGYLPFPFLHYMKAEVNLQKGQYESAKAEYGAFLKKTAGENFVKDSYFKQYLCGWLPGGAGELGLLQEVLARGSLNVEADKHAQRAASRFRDGAVDSEQRALFEARYAFDGGFIPRALAALRGLEESSFRLVPSKIEYNYRMGRILQYQDRTAAAIPYLKKAVEMSEGQDFYFGPSAALQLGYIYRDGKQYETAAGYFRKAMSFRKHEYKNSIDNKARAALTELGVN